MSLEAPSRAKLVSKENDQMLKNQYRRAYNQSAIIRASNGIYSEYFSVGTPMSLSPYKQQSAVLGCGCPYSRVTVALKLSP